MSAYEKAKDWLVSSGLCILDKSDVNVGAVHSFYETKKKEYGFLYPEITGYYISTMKFLYKNENSQNYLEIAKKSGSWLIDLIDKYRYVIQGVNTNKGNNEIVYSFDTSICAKGLLDLYEITDEQKYSAYAKKLLDWIDSDCVESDGTVKPIMDLKSKKFIETSTWFMKKGCFGIKIVMPFLQYENSKNSEFRETAINICNTFTKFQNPNGSFAVHMGGKSVNLHAHCYALEGLIYAYHVFKEPKYLESCKKALDWAIGIMNSDGSIPSWINFNYVSKACYPAAQLIRILILISKIERNLKYKNVASKLTNFILTLQSNSVDSKMNGGFYEELYKSIFGWKKRSRINSWSSMFALQALNWIDNYESISFDESIEYLF